MNCPTCGIKGELQETRRRDEGTMRRYHCQSNHKWKTLEQLDMVYDDAGTKAMRIEQGKKLAKGSV